MYTDMDDIPLNELQRNILNQRVRPSRPSEVKPGSGLTKQLRHEFFGVDDISGENSMKAEKYQRRMIEKGTGYPCKKSDNMRINTETNAFESRPKPYGGVNGNFDWTEDFDGNQSFNNLEIYYNFKCIVGDGGSQTRSIKCVYEFVKAQLKLTNDDTFDKNIIFVNILDGDTCSKHVSKFSHLKHPNIYIGDLYDYFEWLDNRLDTIL